MIIHAGEIYTVDTNAAAIDVRRTDDFGLETFASGPLPRSLSHIHVAHGLAKNDFALFVTAIDGDGALRESFLMQRYMGHGRGIIVPSDDVLEAPGSFLSSELAKKISAVHPEEIIQFGLGSLIKTIKRQYPNIK